MLKYLFGLTRKKSNSKSRSPEVSPEIHKDLKQFRSKMKTKKISALSHEVEKDLKDFQDKHSFSVQKRKLIRTDYAGTQYKLRRLTKTLQKYCPEMSLSILHIGSIPESRHDKYHSFRDYHTDEMFLNSLMICLNDSDECISSIVLDFYGDEVHINSGTKKERVGKKYNTLLRAVSIIISPLIREDGERPVILVSDAINPISAYAMTKFNTRFDTITVDKEKNIIINMDELIKREPTLANIRELFEKYKKYGYMHGRVDLTYENILQAEGVFNELAKKLICV